MASNGKVVVDIVANTSTLTPGIAQAEKTVAKFTTSAVEAGRSAAQMTSGFNMARSGAAQFAVSILGAKSATASLATGLAMAFGATAGPLLAVTAGIGAIAFAYDKLTEKSRKAREETDKAIETLTRAAQLRADPFADQRKALGQVETRVAELRKNIKDLQDDDGKVILRPGREGSTKIERTVIDNTRQIAEKQQELKRALDAVGEAQQQLKDKGDAFVKSLQDQAAVFGKTEYQAQQYAITQRLLAHEISQTQAAAALAAAADIEIARRKKDAHDKATEAAKKQATEVEQLRAKILATQHAWRVEAAGGGNKTAMADGGPNLGDSNLMRTPVPSILQGADVSGLRIEAAAQRTRKALAEQTAIADEWKEAWRNAIAASSQAFTDFLQRAFVEGTKLRDLLKGLLGSIASVFASMASTKLSNVLIHAVGLDNNDAKGMVLHTGGMVGRGGTTRSAPAWLFAQAPRMHNGGLASDEVPAILQTGERVLSRAEVARGSAGGGTTVHVHQNITFAPGFVDGASGEAWLQAKSGTIAGIVARAATDAPAFARHIVASGMRA